MTDITSKLAAISSPKLTRRQTLAGLSASTALTLGGCSAARSGPRPEGIQQAMQIGADRLLEGVGYALLNHEPGRATGLGVDTGRYAEMRGRLADKSQAGLDAYASQLQSDLALVRDYPREGLNADTVTNLDVVESGYQTALDGFALPYGDVAVGAWRNAPYVVIQNVGAYIDYPRFMDATHPVRDAGDIGYYLNRLSALPDVLSGETERMQAARAMGMVPPDFLLDKAIAQMETAIKDAGQGGALVSALTSKIVATMGEDALGEWGERAYDITTQDIAPALASQLEELKAQRAVADSDPGMWSQPQGDEWYAWALRASTTTSLSPDEVHERGLEELEALHARMDPILKDIGYTSGTVGERMQALSQDERYKFSPGDKGREEIFALIDDRIAWIKAQMPRAFNTLVDPNMEVRRIPLNEEPGAPGAYGGAGSKDGSIPGRFWINLRTTDLHRKYDLPDLTFHESIPGHVWEGEYSNRLPLIRSILAFNAFSEGWALYGEQLADELGAYDDFTVGRLGYLQSLAFRACRMVVDTGLHHKRWSREKARNFFVERNGSKYEEVASEVDRYCSWPGQACGYKVGHSEIVRLRSNAEAQLGAAYDVKAFNDAVILGGNAPLDVLAKNVGRYVTSVER
jgi:uncharacterized protein (DUF885 family)